MMLQCDMISNDFQQFIRDPLSQQNVVRFKLNKFGVLNKKKYGS